MISRVLEIRYSEPVINQGEESCFLLNCTWSLGGIDASAGLRYEDVKSDFYENSIYQSDESKHYRNLFPSLSLKGSVGKVHWGLGYHIQVARPYYEQLKMKSIMGIGLLIWAELPICNRPIYIPLKCGRLTGICSFP